MNASLKTELQRSALEIRIAIMEQLTHLGFGHAGGSLSIVDCLAVLYGGVMRVNSKHPQWEDRDRLIMSKGHAGPALYATLALKGFFPVEWLKTLNHGGTKLPSHADGNKTPGIDCTTGSLGQGLSIAIGMAHANKLDAKDATVFCVLGDGEIQEGQVWEAAMAAPHFGLDNLIAFVDWNKCQIDGAVERIIGLKDIARKFADFGWDAKTIAGHDVEVLYEEITAAKSDRNGRPKMFVLDSVKGAGVPAISEMECNHHINVPKELGEPAIANLRQELAVLGQ